jgi:hypothetical protein
MSKYAFVLLMLAFACTEEKITSREYPRIETLNVDLSGEKVIFHGNIFSAGKTAMTDHGFTWSLSFPNIRDSPKISLGTAKTTGEYSGSISTAALTKGKTYTVRAFVISGGYEVYGADETFVVK